MLHDKGRSEQAGVQPLVFVGFRVAKMAMGMLEGRCGLPQGDNSIWGLL